MKDIHGNIIYVGKSKTLNSRVKSYFYTQHKWDKINRMVFYIDDIDFIVTDTHLEAQILECALIKKIKPIYNSQFKNHKKYMFLKVENFNKFKPLSLAHTMDEENCVGPYRSKGILLNLVDFFKNIYPIIQNNNTYEFTYNILPRTFEKHVFEKNKVNLIEIMFNSDCMLEFLSVIDIKMKEASRKLEFEKALLYKNTLKDLEYIYKHNKRERDYSNFKKVLLGIKLNDGFKLFYILNDTIILKKKYKSVTADKINTFLNQAEKLENRIKMLKDKKRHLDFKYIVNTELRNCPSEAILPLDSYYNIEKFMNNLKKIV